MIKTEKANVVDFYSNNEIQQMSIAKVGDLNKIFAKQSGALNIVDGAFNRHAKDSLMFTAFIKKIDDGKILHTFDPVYFNIDEPTKGIKALANKVLGYWDARDDLLLSIPNFDSYKFYMDARSQWLRNDDMAKELLLKSIAADSSFLDPYLLLLGYYYNDRLYSDAHDLIDLIKRKTENLSSREKNVLEYMEAIIHGNNLLSYSIIIKDLEENERDFFTSTDFMIIAFELVNNPAKAIEVFVADPLEDMNLEDCMYCQERYYFAIASYLRLKQYDEAKILIEKLPDILNRWKYYGIQLRYFVRSGSKMAVEENLLKWKKYISVADYKALLYVAARENFLIGDEAEYKKYCTEILNFSKDSHWTNNWAHYFLQNYDEALLGFQDNIANNYDVLRSHSRVGAILAIQGNRDLALKKVEDLEDFRSDFDFGSISYNQARIYLKLGDRQKALALLETSVQEGARFNVNNVFENDPDFIELRDDPKFQRIIHPLENN